LHGRKKIPEEGRERERGKIERDTLVFENAF
jgi:hypothetical protein